MTLNASAHSVPGTLQQVVVVAGRHMLTTDEPESLGGDDTAAAPHELVAAALAACVSTTLVMFARTKDWDLGEVHVDVEFDHRATPRRFEVEISLDGDLDAAQVERLERVAATCPVKRSFEAGAEFVEHIKLLQNEGGSR